jgi:hypothetical protein
MFKEIVSGLSKFFGKKWIPILLLIVLSFGILAYSSSKGNLLDRMTDGSVSAPAVPQVAAVPSPSASMDGGYSLQPVANPSDLLPSDKNSQWAALNPINQGNVAMPDLLQAGYHIGLDTIGQTLKNANLQLRSDPIIEKKEVSPWSQSTIDPDFARVPLEVGIGAR